MQSILIVDDMEFIHEMLDTVVQPAEYTTIYAKDGDEAISIYKEKCPDLVLTDLKMEPMDGLELMRRLKEIDPKIFVIIKTGHADVDNAMASMKLGAFDYLTKPFKLDQLMAAINRADERIDAMIVGEGHDSNFALLGDSDASQKLKQSVSRTDESNYPALIKGPKGTQMELVASAIHGASSDEEENDEQPFESIDCEEVSPDELVEQLIGPNKCSGRLVEKVAGGTMLIEYIDRLPVELQPDLGNAIRKAKGEARFLFTTAADLDAAAADGTYDESLFYRISTQSIDCPGLDKRLEDIPLFAKSELQGLGKKSVQINDDAQRLLQGYDWPGNFAEFRQMIENAVTDCSDDTIEVPDLPDCIRETKQWSSLAGYLEAASREYTARILNACQGDSKKAAKILGCESSEVS
ncbi:MAG: response regulator [Verrucomicrobiota bacterium]|nr:response regulator [Verrucomicrobiota bacterium]